MAILCRKQVLFLAFPTRESLRQWEATIRAELGEDRQFPVCLVKGPKEARLPLGNVKLCIQGQNLCIVTLGHSPPEVLSSWHVTDLRRFGVIDDKFCFEGGSQCGEKGAGVHVFRTEQGEEINRLLQQASQKRLSRANSSATCRRNVRVNQRGATFRSCSAYLDWTHIYPDTDRLRLYDIHNGLRRSQLEHNNTSSEEIDADYPCNVEEQKLRSIDRWNRHRLNTIYSTSSCPDCHSCFSHASNTSNLIVGGSTVEVTKSTTKNSAIVTESTYSGQYRLSVGCAGESKDSRSVASSDSDEVFASVESDYYNILPPPVDYYNILPQQSEPSSLSGESPASCSNFLGSAPRGETVHQSKPQNVALQSVKSVAYRNKRNRIVHRSYTLPRTIHEFRTDIYPLDSSGSLTTNTSSSTSNKVVNDTVDVLSDDIQAYHVSDYEHVRVYDAVSETYTPPSISTFHDVLDDSVKLRPISSENCESDSMMALPSCHANTSMASHAYGAARVCSNSDESPYMNLSVPQNTSQAPCGLQAQEAHSGEVRIDPLRPLEYINLKRFDGVDETYSCWIRAKSETPPPMLPPPPPPPVHTDSQERHSSGGRHGNSPHSTPTRSASSKVELPKKHLEKANRFLSFHGSLKRQTKSKSSSEKSLPEDSSCRRSHSMHSGKLPRCGSFGHTLPRPGSVDCVNHAGFSVANSSISEAGSLPPRPTRAPSMQSVSEYHTPSSIQPNAGSNSHQYTGSQQNLCASTRSDYMMMDPSSTTAVTVTSNTVFCTVDLPLKRTNSTGGRSRNASFSGSNGGGDRGGKGMGYLEMSQVDAAKGMGRSMSMRENAGMSPPPLHHSKSWGNELESNYLQMSCNAAGDYIKMSPTDMDRLSGAPQLEIRPLKPFDNLLEHKHHLHRKPIVTPRVQPFRDVPDRMGSDSKPSSDEDSASKASNGKTPGLFSRLIRRNSSKKASRSQEDILIATAVEKVPEACQMNTISHVRTKSADMLDDAPQRGTSERQRSMSYSDMSFSRYGLSEQKPRSLLFAVPPAPGVQSDTGLFVSVPPPVPPRVTGGSSSSLAGGRPDSTTYVTVAAVSTDTGDYFTVGPGVSTTSRQTVEGPYISTGYTPRIFNTTISDSNSARCVENQMHRPIQSTCPSRQPELPRSGDNSPEGDYLMVWANSPGKSSSSDSPVVLAPSRTSSAFDRPARRSASEMYANAMVTKTDPIPIPAPQAKLNEEEHSCSSASPPALPEKTYRRTSYSSRGYLALPARRRTINLAEGPPTDSPSHSCYSSDAESMCLPAKTAAEKLKHIPSLQVSIPSVAVPREEPDGIWMHRDIAPMQEEMGCSRSTANGLTSYEGAETMSVVSHGSSDTPSSIRSDELKSCTSPASTTLRPRSGKEYQKLDRRKLAEDLNIPIEELLTPKSPSVSSTVFTFDSTVVSLRASPASAYSCGEDSPNMLTQRYSSVNRTDSLRSSETSPPGSCMSLVGNPDISEEALLNYAEIDLSDSEASHPPRRSGNEIEYAIIDMVATVTASRVGKEHAQLREDKLQQNVQRQDSCKEREFVTRRVKEKRFSSMSSRDKKLSLTSIISSNSKGKKSSL